MQVICQ